MDAPRVPVHIPDFSPRLQAALKLAAGAAPGGALSAALNFLCEQLAVLCASPVASVYVLEGKDELVLRGNYGFDRRALGEVRLQVGEGITGTAVETLRPVTVDDAGLTAQFAYFPQLAEERYPAFLAVPLLSGTRARGALVLQRAAGPFASADILLAVASTRAIAAAVEAEHPQDANLLLHGQGNGCGKALGMARVLSRSLPRRDTERRGQATADELRAAFSAEREELRDLLQRARAAVGERSGVLEEIATLLDDARLEERAHEHLAAGLSPSIALERIAAEYARTLSGEGPAGRRAADVEAFVGAIAHRLAGLDTGRLRRGELMVSVHLAGLSALRGWSKGATGALCAASADSGTGAALLSALGVPVVSGVRHLFESLRNGDRVALDGQSGEVIVNPTAAQAAAARK